MFYPSSKTNSNCIPSSGQDTNAIKSVRRQLSFFCRRNHSLALLFLFAGIIIFSVDEQQARAIVTEDTSLSESDPANTSTYSNFNWDVAYNIPGGSAVAVDRYWTLTAEHVPGGNFLQNDIYYTVLEEHSHSEADLRLTRYDNPFPDWYPIYTGDYPLPPPPTVTKITGLMVGYGRSGNVLTATTYEWHGSGTADIRRWGDSLIDDANNRGDLGIGDYIDLKFDTGPTEYGAGAASGDSGGGVFVYDDGWYLAGIMSLVYSPETDVFSGTLAVDLTSYEEWIMLTVPEPGTAFLLLTAGILLLANRRFGGVSAG